jgi:uncharacterized protein (DUF1778 family)
VSKAKPKGGRPRMDPSTTKDTVMTIRFSRDERALVAAAAAKEAEKDSEWARRVLLAATARPVR